MEEIKESAYLHNLYSTPKIDQMKESETNDGAYSRPEGGVLTGKPERKRPLKTPWRRWEDNIKIDLQVMGCGLNSTG